ncbi:Ig-like domain-containing protein [Williamsia sp. D3]|uniref:L,D-transpeptidase n=1 Tax=Williamsia TaxID=85043 RepID=UPI00040E3D43|nr:Ig-like domain-containing protein [Williamsia sp. D3]
MRTPHHGGLLVLVLAMATLAACSSSPSPSTLSSSSPAATSAVDAPQLTITPGDGTTTVKPTDRVEVQTSMGTLESVVLTNETGAQIDGFYTPDRIDWKPAVPLGYGRTYTLTATAVHENQRTVRTMSFSTVTPGNQTKPTFVSTGGNLLTDGATYGVGMVVVAQFDEPIGDRAAAERSLEVRTDPPVTGSWNWVDERNVHWRPREYYAPGTTVTVNANIYGVQLGENLFGQEDVSTSFTIGDAHVSIADDTTKQVSVFSNGQLVRTMPTSMGRGGTETVNGRTIHFWTQSGTYTVLDKANPVIMDSSTYGLPVNSRLGYRQSINYATRISNDGIYLHELVDTIAQQGNTNMSAGCLNLNPDNARWFYDFSVPGDIVEVRNTGGPPLELWQNGDWSVAWGQWLDGSALQ